MKLFSHVSPQAVLSQFFPCQNQTTVLELGLHSLDESRWILPDEDWLSFYDHKNDCLKRCAQQVSLGLPSSLRAQNEYAGLLVKYLLQYFPDKYVIENNQLRYTPHNITWSLEEKNLANLGSCIQEDICIMEKQGGKYQLTAGHVCSPSGWKLEEKMGKGLEAIHSPVPRYEKQLADRVNRLLENLKTNKPVLRFNWSLQYGNELGVRDDWNFENRNFDINGLDHQQAEYKKNNKNIYWRVERQTLRRLPESKAIIFSIRIFLNPLAQLAEDSIFLRHLKSILSQLPEDEIRYKSLQKLKEDIDLLF